jgi:hypothetical protein
MHRTATNPVLMASTSAHAVGNQSDALQQILAPGVNLCLWQRPPQPSVSRELMGLQASQLTDARCWTSATAFDNDVTTLLQKQGLDPLAFEHWRMDLQRLAELFFNVSPKRKVALRLETIEGDGCRRFHVDRKHLRLLCTYRGPGTEWLSNAQVDRVAQNDGAPNDHIIRYGEPSQFEPFWVGIMKGNAYPGNIGCGLVHRSPPIAGTGQTRVLFCLDC